MKKPVKLIWQYNKNLIACSFLNQAGACLNISTLEEMEHASTFSHKVNARLDLLCTLVY